MLTNICAIGPVSDRTGLVTEKLRQGLYCELAKVNKRKNGCLYFLFLLILCTLWTSDSLSGPRVILSWIKILFDLIWIELVEDILRFSNSVAGYLRNDKIHTYNVALKNEDNIGLYRSQ